MSRPTRLEDGELARRLSALPEWRRDGGEIVREYKFESYAHGALFAAGVALLADRMDHHPDLLLAYRRVEIRLSTHDAGGITELDLTLAERMETLFTTGS